ncbi:specifically androgen-regulated gene protein [Carettochelys insculpta]|uniref:specifically androgen-regulated gene protein n=1 Tax=Carettochelys insculpta TaxID=44489 RepID=UPI003EBE032A
MPKEDLWLGAAGQDSGRCDSMVSTNSSCSELSDNSYDYLSVEEKECLLFLEETLESLDAEDDSGVSADETDSAERSKLPRTWPKRGDVPKNLDRGSPTGRLGQRHAVEQNNDQCGSLLSSSAPEMVRSSGYYSLPRSINAASLPTTKVLVNKTADLTDGPAPTAQETVGHSWKMLKTQLNNQPSENNQLKPPHLASVIIQPPEPFRDPREANTRWLAKNQKANGHGEELFPNDLEAKGKLTEAIGNKARAASLHSAPENAGLLLKEESKPLETGRERATIHGSQEKLDSEASPDSNAKQRPPTAPKPRKLPPNIILKPSKISPAPVRDPPHTKGVSPSSPKQKSSPTECSLEKQERARQEALAKLGLLQDKGRESKVHVVRPPTAPKPKSVHVLTSRAGSRDNLKSDDGTSVPAHEKPDKLAPNLSLADQAASGSRQMIKSNSMEHSGIGLSSEDQAGDSRSLDKAPVPERTIPSAIRNSRPRPLSLGTGKDFVDLKASKTDEELEKGEKHRSYLKFPRPTSVSVKITPKGATDQHRREALKKLGLLKE